jgi:glyoxylase-like metal-dependent hydrolase (beta-lactamase superfamily II)
MAKAFIRVRWARAAAAAMLLTIGASAQIVLAPRNQGNEDLGVYPVAANFYMIAGAGGNIAVQFGPDGAVLVDSGSGKMTDKVLATVAKLSDQPIRYIINTSADADHTGGNAAIAKAGQSFLQNAPGLFAGGPTLGAVDTQNPAAILATENVLRRMSAPVGGQPASPYAALPTETFANDETSLYVNREAIKVIAQPAAHTDGDAIVFFRRSDVIVAGDIIDTDHFPVIDLGKGGSIQGEIAALNRIIKIAVPSIPLVWQDGGTYVIPGHGWLCDQADVVEYRDMVTIVRDVIQDLIRQGKTLEEIKAANPTQGYRTKYGSDSGVWTTDMFVEAIYKSLTAKK